MAEEKGLKVIEDCAHTTGSLYKGKALGTWGDVGCFSFEEKKLMTTGDGGMICSNDTEILKDIRAMRWVGIDKDNWRTAQAYTESNMNAMHWFYELNILGYKYNMNDFAASIGLVQLSRLKEMNSRRSMSIKMYMNEINELEGIKPLLPFEPDKYVYQMFGIRVTNKDEMIIHLKSKGIATGCHYTPLSIQPLFKKWGNNCPYIEKEISRFITLPLHADLTETEIDYIVENLMVYG